MRAVHRMQNKTKRRLDYTHRIRSERLSKRAGLVYHTNLRWWQCTRHDSKDRRNHAKGTIDMEARREAPRQRTNSTIWGYSEILKTSQEGLQEQTALFRSGRVRRTDSKTTLSHDSIRLGTNRPKKSVQNPPQRILYQRMAERLVGHGSNTNRTSRSGNI